jgi:hypothetical protein
MKKFLAVGINHFLRPGNDLNGCMADADAMRDIATALGATTYYLENIFAPKTLVMEHLTNVVLEAKAGKLSYLGFAYSAHGTHYPRPEEPDGLGEALCCYDTDEKDGDWNPDTIIKDTELRNLLNQVPLTCTVEVWLDTCYSGGMDKGFELYKNRFLHNPGNVAKALRLSNSTMNQGMNSNIVVWTACSEAQESADAYISGGPHGAFTWYWCKAFEANPKGSRVELLLATRAGLRAGGFDQFPRLKCWNQMAQGRVGS